MKSRQFTERVVTVANNKIFDEPVFNYTHDFPFIREEISIPLTYETDRAKTEEIMLAATRKYTLGVLHTFTKMFDRLKEDYKERVEDIILRILPALGIPRADCRCEQIAFRFGGKIKSVEACRNGKRD